MTEVEEKLPLTSVYFSVHGLSPGSYSGGGGNSYGSESYISGGEGLGSYGNDQNGLESHQSEGSDGGDYHHGVSVVSLETQKGQTFDLTKHGGGKINLWSEDSFE